MFSRLYMHRLKRVFTKISLLAVAALACRFPLLGAESPQVTTLASTPTGEQRAVPAARAEDLARATVQVVTLVREGANWVPLWSGSGSIIDPDGTVLTNQHVVDRSLFSYDAVGIAVTNASDQPPSPAYLAEVIAEDAVLDLAVVRAATDLDGAPVADSLPFVRLGDSDAIEIGDRLRILGYPGIGGETITFTEGAVSGFTLERGIDGRAWIKTDATIAGGNSGGLGANMQGELVGIPTIVTSGSKNGETVDCRPLADTDRDGDIDEQDACVPVGGFINALRPVKLAMPLIEAARSGQAYVPGVSSGLGPTSDTALDAPIFSNLVFSDGVTPDDQPSQLWYSLPASPTRVCAFWDYRGMSNGLAWSSYWFVDGKLDETGSVSGQAWGGAGQGNWWTCLANERGLPSGVYEVVLDVKGSVLLTDAVYVGGDRSLASLDLLNGSSSAICEVNISPSGAGNWGQNDIGSDPVMPAESREIPLASGEYDLRLLGCDGASLLEEFTVMIEGTYERQFTGP